MRDGTGRWLITAAVEQEIRGIRDAVKGRPEGSDGKGRPWSGEWKGKPLLLVRTGVGPQRTREVLAPVLSNHRIRGIVSTGYAGALRGEYRLGDILIPAEILTAPPLPEVRLQTDAGLRECLLEAARSGPWRVHRDPMITVDRVIFSSREKRRLGLSHEAGSVEMESAIVAELAESRSVPFAVARVVLDEASFSLPDLGMVFRWWRKRRFARLIPYLAVRPREGVALLRLLRRSREASRCLTDLFRGYLLDSLSGETWGHDKPPVQASRG